MCHSVLLYFFRAFFFHIIFYTVSNKIIPSSCANCSLIQQQTITILISSFQHCHYFLACFLLSPRTSVTRRFAWRVSDFLFMLLPKFNLAFSLGKTVWILTVCVCVCLCARSFEAKISCRFCFSRLFLVG